MAGQENTPTRQTARPCSVVDLLHGEYITQEGWQPNYVMTPYGSYTRINLIGIIVDKPTPYQLRVDDGTGNILVTDFNHAKKTVQLQVGDPVLIIGRVRKANDELFIAAEIATSDQLKANQLFIAERKEALAKRQAQAVQRAPEDEGGDDEEEQGPQEKSRQQAAPTQTSDQNQQVTGDDLIEFMKKKDDGNGVNIDDIVDYFGQDADDLILTMISMGEIYEIKPGVVRVLE